MNYLIIAFILAITNNVVSTAEAAFVIRLRNGNEFVTSRYWQDGQQLLFAAYGGTVGIARAFVAEVAPLDKLIQSPTLRKHPGDGNPKQASENEQSGLPAVSGTTNKDINDDENDSILKEFNALKHKSSTLKGMLTSELNELSENVRNLKRKIQTSGKSNHYLNQFIQLHKIGDELEELLKTRN